MTSESEGPTGEVVEDAIESITLDWSRLDEIPIAFSNVTAVIADFDQHMFYLAFGAAAVPPGGELSESQSGGLRSIKVRPSAYIALNPYVMTTRLGQMQTSHNRFGERIQAAIQDMEAGESTG